MCASARFRGDFFFVTNFSTNELLKRKGDSQFMALEITLISQFFHFILSVLWGQGSSVDIVTRLRIVERGIVVEILANDRKLHSYSYSPYQFCGHVTSSSVDIGSAFACVNWLRPDTDYIPPSSPEVKNDWSYISASPILLHVAYD